MWRWSWWPFAPTGGFLDRTVAALADLQDKWGVECRAGEVGVADGEGRPARGGWEGGGGRVLRVTRRYGKGPGGAGSRNHERSCDSLPSISRFSTCQVQRGASEGAHTLFETVLGEEVGWGSQKRALSPSERLLIQIVVT